MSAWGVTDDDYGDQDSTLILPDNMDAVNLFIQMSTQWRVGPAGAIGLDYNVLLQWLRVHGMPRKKWPAVLEDIQVMEGEALNTMSDK